MTTEPAYLKLLHSVQAQRRTTLQSFALAVVFAAEVILAGVILRLIYNGFHLTGFNWAFVSAILVLQPGLEQSYTTALVRIAANIIGAAAGLVVGYYFGIHTSHVFLAIVIVIFICELFRLDLGVRSACVSVIIVMTTGDGRVIDSATVRFIAVLSGCSLALLLQLLVETVLSRLWLAAALAAAARAAPKQPVDKSAHTE